MATLRRWISAQHYEKSFWLKLASKIEAGTRNQLDWYQWKASELEKRLKEYVDQGEMEQGRVLEIGSGPIGIVNFLEGSQRFAIDPLEEFYRESSTLSKLRKPGVIYARGAGEHLPYPDSFFSLVIIDNVIDHTRRPRNVLQEIYRVLDGNGILYLIVNVRTRWGTTIHRLLSSANVDRGHPHSFTKQQMRDLIIEHGFAIYQEEAEDYFRVRQKNRDSGRLKDKIKGYSGISEYQYFVIAQKTSRNDGGQD